MTDAEHRTVERQHMIVVIPDGKSSLDDDRLLAREIESTKPAPSFCTSANIIYERLPIMSPVGCFERLLRCVYLFQLAVLDVEDFQHAPDVVTIRNKTFLDR